MKYRPEIDGLRAVAVVPVILFHAGFAPFAGGFVGVDIFFVISGYLITSIILKESAEGQFSIVKFYERRARRILPALFLVLLCCLPFAWIYLTPADMRDFAQSLIGVATFSSNFLFWLESGYFDTAAELKPLLHTWSLAVEEQFYIIYPLIIMAAWRFGRHTVVWITAVIFVVSLIYSQWAALNTPSAAFFLLPARAWELMIGAFAAFYLAREDRRFALPDGANQVLSLLGIAAIALTIAIYDEHVPFPGFYALLPTVGTVLIILCAQERTLVWRVLSAPALVGIGLVSYSAYLWHQPLFVFARQRSLEEPSTLLMGILCIVTFALAYGTWLFVETPYRRKGVVSRAHVFRFATVGIVGFAAIGLVGDVNDGFKGRISQDYLDRLASQNAGQKARHEAVQNGICHFSQRGKYRRIDEFTKNWACAPEGSGATGTAILVFGDSHGADKAMALRENAVDFAQITGARCALAPGRVSVDYNYCMDLFDLVDRRGSVGTVILASEFIEEDISDAYLAEVFDYWAARAERVYLFTPMPDFQLPFDQYMKFGSATFAPSDQRAQMFRTALESSEIPENVTIVETKRILCADDVPECRVAFDPTPLILDAGHLSLDGARRFGKRLIESGVISALATD